jgi:4-amino-4-deoxy-L-arabinose transferase-like glycosyltransferase
MRNAWNASIHQEIILVLIVYILVQLIGHNNYPLWFDELFSAYWIDHPQSFLWGDGRIEEANPPLYYSVLRAFSAVFGTSETSLRYLSVVAGALAAAMAIIFGRITGRPGLGLLSGLVFAAMPTANLFAQEARPVAFLPLMQGAVILGCSLELRRAWILGQQGQQSWSGGAASAILLVVASWLAIHTHPLSAILVAASFMVLGTVALTYRSLGLRALLRWLVIGTVVLVLSIPQGILLIQQSGTAVLDWRDPFQAMEIPRTSVELLVGEGVFGFPVVMKLAISGLLLLIAFRGLLALEPPLRWSIGGIPLLFFGMVSLASFAKPLLMTRYMLGVTVPIAVLVAMGIDTLGRSTRVRRAAAAGIVGVLAVLSFRQSIRAENGEWHNTQDWRGVTAAITADASCRGPVFSNVAPGVVAWPYYDPAGKVGPRYLVVPDASKRPQFLARETHYSIIDHESFLRFLRAGGPLAVVYVGRRAGESSFARTVRAEAGGPIVSHDFPPALSMACVGHARQPEDHEAITGDNNPSYSSAGPVE